MFHDFFWGPIWTPLESGTDTQHVSMPGPPSQQARPTGRKVGARELHMMFDF